MAIAGARLLTIRYDAPFINYFRQLHHGRKREESIAVDNHCGGPSEFHPQCHFFALDNPLIQDLGLSTGGYCGRVCQSSRSRSPTGPMLESTGRETQRITQLGRIRACRTLGTVFNCCCPKKWADLAQRAACAL